MIAVGAVAQQVVESARPAVRMLKTRSPLRTSAAQREEIRGMFERARLDAYPAGLHREE